MGENIEELAEIYSMDSSVDVIEFIANDATTLLTQYRDLFTEIDFDQDLPLIKTIMIVSTDNPNLGEYLKSNSKGFILTYVSNLLLDVLFIEVERVYDALMGKKFVAIAADLSPLHFELLYF